MATIPPKLPARATETERAVAASNRAMSRMLLDGTESERADARRSINGVAEFSAQPSFGAAAFHSDGWITFMPTMSRELLVGAGAYTPGKADRAKGLRGEDELWNRRTPADVRSTLRHEPEHSISPRSEHDPIGSRWLEEGTAEVLSGIRSNRTARFRGTPLADDEYGRQLLAPDEIDLGWKQVPKTTLFPPQQPYDGYDEWSGVSPAVFAGVDYVRSAETVTDLVRLAGGELRSNAGIARARELLQSTSLGRVPGRLADAIIEEHGLDPAQRERLRERIKHAVDIPGGVRAMAREFGLPTDRLRGTPQGRAERREARERDDDKIVASAPAIAPSTSVERKST